MDGTHFQTGPRVAAAIAAVKDALAHRYRDLPSALASRTGHTLWQESHGALCMIGHPALVRLSEEVCNLFADAADEQAIAATVEDASAAILRYLEELIENATDRPARLLPSYRAVLRARGIEHIPQSALFEAAEPDSPLEVAMPRDVAIELKHLNEVWCRWAAREASVETLAPQIEALKLAALTVRPGPLAELIRETCSAMDAQTARREPAPDAVVEISSALLMLEDLVEDAPRATATFPQRAANACVRLRACEGDCASLQQLPPMELLDARAQRDEAKVVLLAQADAVIGNVMSVLQVFYQDVHTRHALGALDKPLAQCIAMFAMLQDEKAAEALSVCREEIARLADTTRDDAATRERLARRLTAIAEYVLASRVSDANLDMLLARAGLGTATAETVAGAKHNGPVEAFASQSQPTEPTLDDEMLDVFLEEAGEVLTVVEATLPLSEGDPRNAEHLTSLRRAFHTLKGSGRMVGLLELGEAAWEMEQVFNKIAQNGLSGTPELYGLVRFAREDFVKWIAELSTRRGTRMDFSKVVEWARRVRAGEPATLSTPAAQEEPTSERIIAAGETQTVKIGDTVIPAVLYSIFIEEAQQHIATLQQYGKRIATQPAAAAAPDFLRAAHTLCGIAATVGVDSLSELASSLERALLRVDKTGETPDSDACVCIAQAVARLAYMVSQIGERHLPISEPGLVDCLNRALVSPRPASSLAASTEATGGKPPMTDRPASPNERRTTRLDDDLDAELLTVFLTEAEELLPPIAQNLRDWRARAGDKLVPQSLQRLLHTLKGSARMAGAMAVGELTHRMETRVENAARLVSVPESLHDELYASYDRLNELIDNLHRLDTEPETTSQDVTLTTLTGGFDPDIITTVTQPVLTTAHTPPDTLGASASGPVAPATDPKMAPQRTVLRVRADSAERLANQAGEVAIARTRAETELRSARVVMRELTENIVRLRGQLREIEMQAEMQMQSRIAQAEETRAHFDPLEFDRFTRLQELTRLMAESVNDVATVQQNLMRNLEEGEAALGAQARTTRELQDDLVRIRMAPFSSLSDRLYRVARVASKDVGRRVQLDIRGGHAELDRGVLDRIVAPLEHLLRNSIAHGIEAQAVRVSAGKPELGEIVIEVRQEGNEVVLGIADDGAGLDIGRIRAQAVKRGLMREDEALSEAQIADFIFRSGFSTADQVSEIAGRGVGLDVVRNEITSLGGRIEMDFERGKGTRFTVYLSLALAVMKAVVIRAGEELYSVPSLLVEQVQTLKPDALSAAYSAREINWRETRYALHYLGHLLGRTHAAPSQQRYNPVLLVRSGPHRVAIHVDQLLGGQEIVVKNIGPQLARISGVTGAAVLGSGETVLILNPVQLSQRNAVPAQPAVDSAAPKASAPPPTTVAAPASAPLVPKAPSAAPLRQATVLVVDDSLTVRKITSRTLTREGYNVVVAKDGIEALEKMQARAPDVIVTDIEMPRMDGFDLTRNVRADPKLKDLPVIMITSRTADKHRQHAAELGVTVFLGKPYEERELLQNIAGVARVPA